MTLEPSFFHLTFYFDRSETAAQQSACPVGARTNAVLSIQYMSKNLHAHGPPHDAVERVHKHHDPVMPHGHYAKVLIDGWH